MKREELKKLGLTEEQIDAVMASHGQTVQGLNNQISSFQQTEANLNSQLSEANKTLKSLEEKTKDNPDVQKELSDLKEKAQTLEKENTDLKINGQVSAALQASGAKDIDYALFKLGKLELDKERKVKDLDNKIKDLQSNLPDYFSKQETNDKESQQNGGYKPVDNKLEEGKTGDDVDDPFAAILSKYE